MGARELGSDCCVGVGLFKNECILNGSERWTESVMARGPFSSELGNSAVLDTHSLWVGGSVFACWEREVGHFAQCFLPGSFSSVESGVQ